MTPACLPLLCLPLVQVTADAPDPATPKQPVAAKIYQVLDEETAVKFVDMPFNEAIAELGQQHGINFVLNATELKRAGVDESTPVNLILDGVRLRSTLKILLSSLDLDFSVQDEVVMISSAADIKSAATLHSYDISALLEDGDIDALVTAVREQIPESPEQTARVSGYRNLLLVTGNRYVQERVQRTLKVLAKGLRNDSPRLE